MGTRHLIAVQSDDEYKVAQYGQWDGYPSGQGIGILSFLKDENSVAALRKNLSKVRFIDNEKDREFLDAYDKAAPKYSSDPDNRTPEQKHWFNTYITRNLGSEILNNIAFSEDKEILLNNSISFAADSLFCEYAYVVDFDKGTFEIYSGFNKGIVPKDSRFSNLELEKDSEYGIVTLVKEYNLNSLPEEKDFLSDLELQEDDE
jgi:hypothetical protein